MNLSPSCDVAVIGAGPAGATAAYLLARHGYEVRLFDRHRFPRPKLCAGLLTWKSIELLARIFGYPLDRLKAQGLLRHSCREYRIYYRMNEIGRGRLDFPFHFIDRPTYDQHWLRMAEAAGARATLGMAVDAVDAETGRLDLADGQVVSARLIIGADGVWSKARRSMPQQHLTARRWRNNLAATIEMRHPGNGPPPSFASLHFGYCPWGYAWSFPGKAVRTLGMAGLRTSRSGSIRNAFRAFLDAAGVDPETETLWRGYPLPYGNYLTEPAHRRLLLVGDAAGLADPLLGEGIYYAHASARIAAQAIIDADLQAERAGRLYGVSLKRSLIRELRWIKLWRAALFTGGRHRRFRGLRLFCSLLPKQLEAAVQGQRSFSPLWFP